MEFGYEYGCGYGISEQLQKGAECNFVQGGLIFTVMSLFSIDVLGKHVSMNCGLGLGLIYHRFPRGPFHIQYSKSCFGLVDNTYSKDGQEMVWDGSKVHTQQMVKRWSRVVRKGMPYTYSKNSV